MALQMSLQITDYRANPKGEGKGGYGELAVKPRSRHVSLRVSTFNLFWQSVWQSVAYPSS